MKLVSRGTANVPLLRSIVPDIVIVEVESFDDMLREATDADVVLGAAPDTFPELLRAGQKLSWVHTSTAGVDRFICDELREGGVVLTCAKDGPAGPNLADHAMALLLTFSRNIAKSARAATWRREEFAKTAFELSGKTAAIAGYGAAGREIAKRAAAFGMSVLATKLNPPHTPDGVAIVSPPDVLPDLVAQSDVVFNTLPGTAATNGLFSNDLFARFKPGSIFINVGRGTTVDTDALVRALEKNMVVAAGLDVVDPEPLPNGHPLWTMGNVVITPHIAGVASQRADRNSRLIADNLKRLVNGEQLKSRVDPEAGY